MKNQNNELSSFDSQFAAGEQLPRLFSMSFEEVGSPALPKVKVSLNHEQKGDIIDDNAYVNDFYRYHDIFHYTFATILGWSPCTRAMLGCKRKSNQMVDKVDDGARAALTEEAVSLLIFNEAKRKFYFKGVPRVSKTTLKIIKEMTEPFEVKSRTTKEWEIAILKGYAIFRLLVRNRGGKVDFDMYNRSVNYSLPN